jgi:hypothetical protein
MNFPTAWERKWRFVMNVEKRDSGVGSLFVGLQAVPDENEENDPGIKFPVNLTSRLVKRSGTNFQGDFETKKP